MPIQFAGRYLDRRSESPLNQDIFSVLKMSKLLVQHSQLANNVNERMPIVPWESYELKNFTEFKSVPICYCNCIGKLRRSYFNFHLCTNFRTSLPSADGDSNRYRSPRLQRGLRDENIHKSRSDDLSPFCRSMIDFLGPPVVLKYKKKGTLGL